MGDVLNVAGAAIAGDHFHGVTFQHVLGAGVVGGDGADVDQRYRHVCAAHIDRGVFAFRIELELEGDVFHGVAVIIDMDFVNGVIVQGKIIGTAIGILQGQVVGDQGHIPVTAGLIAVEHIEVRAIDFGHAGDERGLAVAGCQRSAAGQQRGGGADRRQENRAA